MSGHRQIQRQQSSSPWDVREHAARTHGHVSSRIKTEGTVLRPIFSAPFLNPLNLFNNYRTILLDHVGVTNGPKTSHLKNMPNEVAKTRPRRRTKAHFPKQRSFAWSSSKPSRRSFWVHPQTRLGPRLGPGRGDDSIRLRASAARSRASRAALAVGSRPRAWFPVRFRTEPTAWSFKVFGRLELKQQPNP